MVCAGFCAVVCRDVEIRIRQKLNTLAFTGTPNADQVCLVELLLDLISTTPNESRGERQTSAMVPRSLGCAPSRA